MAMRKSRKSQELGFEKTLIEPTKRTKWNRTIPNADQADESKENAAMASTANNIQNQAEIAEVVEAVSINNAGDISQRSRIDYGDVKRDRGSGTDKESKAETDDDNPLSPCESDSLDNIIISPLKTYKKCCKTCDQTGKAAAEEEKEEEEEEEEVIRQPASLLSCNDTRFKSGTDLKNDDTEQDRTIPTEYCSHITIEQMFESIIQSMVDTKLSTSDTSTNDADQLISLMGDNNSHNVDEGEKKDGGHCGRIAPQSTDMSHTASTDSASTKSIDATASVNPEKQPNECILVDLTATSNADMNKTSVPVPTTSSSVVAPPKGSALDVPVNDGSFNIIDGVETYRKCVKLSQSPIRSRRSIKIDNQCGKLPRALSLSMDRVSDAARNLIYRVRSRSLSPPKRREALDLFINSGKTFMRRSKNALLALGCLSYETDSDKTELSEFDDGLSGSNLLPERETSFEMCQGDDSFILQSAHEKLEIKLTVDQETLADQSIDKESVTSEDVSHQTSIVSTLVEFFERREHDSLFQDKFLPKCNIPVVRAETTLQTVGKMGCDADLTNSIENQRKEIPPPTEISSYDSKGSPPKANHDLRFKQTDELYMGQDEVEQFDRHDHGSVYKQVDTRNESESLNCSKADLNIGNLDEQNSGPKIQISKPRQPGFSTAGSPFPGGSKNLLKEDIADGQREEPKALQDTHEAPIPSSNITLKCCFSEVVADIDACQERVVTPPISPQRKEPLSETAGNSLECPISVPPPNSPNSGPCLESKNVERTVFLFETRSVLFYSNAQEADNDTILNETMGSRSAEARLEGAIMNEKRYQQKEIHSNIKSDVSSRAHTDNIYEPVIDDINKMSLQRRSFPIEEGGKLRLQTDTVDIYTNLDMKSDSFACFNDEDIIGYPGKCNLEAINKRLNIKSDPFVSSTRDNERNDLPDFSSASGFVMMKSGTFNGPSEQFEVHDDGTPPQHGSRKRLTDGNAFKSDSILCPMASWNSGQKLTEKANSYGTLFKLPEEQQKLAAIDELPSPPSMSPCSSGESVDSPSQGCNFEDLSIDSVGDNDVSRGEITTLESSRLRAVEKHRGDSQHQHLFGARLREDYHLRTCEAVEQLQRLESNQTMFCDRIDSSSGASMSLPAVTVEDWGDCGESGCQKTGKSYCGTALDTPPLAIQRSQRQQDIARSSHSSEPVGRNPGQSNWENNDLETELSRECVDPEMVGKAEIMNASSPSERFAALSRDYHSGKEDPSPISTTGEAVHTTLVENERAIAFGALKKTESIDNGSGNPVLLPPLSPFDSLAETHQHERGGPHLTGASPEKGRENRHADKKKQIAQPPRCVRWDVDQTWLESSSDSTSLSIDEEEPCKDRCNSCSANNDGGDCHCWDNGQDKGKVVPDEPLKGSSMTNESQARKDDANGRSVFDRNNNEAFYPTIKCIVGSNVSIERKDRRLPASDVKDVTLTNLASSLERRLSAALDMMSPIALINDCIVDLCTGTHAVNTGNIVRETSQVEEGFKNGKGFPAAGQYINSDSNPKSPTSDYHVCLHHANQCQSDEGTLSTAGKSCAKSDTTSSRANDLTRRAKPQKLSTTAPSCLPAASSDHALPSYQNGLGGADLRHPKPRPETVQAELVSPIEELNLQRGAGDTIGEKMEHTRKRITRTLSFVERAQRRIDQCDALIDKSLNTLKKSSEVSNKCRSHLESVNRLLNRKNGKHSFVGP